VLKLTVIYCHGHIKRKALHDLWSYAYARLATIFFSCSATRGFVSDSWATCTHHSATATYARNVWKHL